MLIKRLLLLTALLTFTLVAAMAATPDTTLTIAVTGTLGPILQGTDPLGANGHSGTLTVKISESASPMSADATSATYIVPAGGVTAVIGSTPFTTTTPSKMTITLGAAADTLNVIYNSQNSTTTRFIAFLNPGSFSTAVLVHPTTFSPSPQKLTSASAAAERGSQLWYTSSGSLTVLGLTGSISNSAALSQLPSLGPEF